MSGYYFTLTIAERIWLDCQVRYDPSEEIIVTPGVKQGLWYVFTALLNEGEEVLTPEPSWVSYSAAVSLAGGKLIQVPTAAEDNYFPSKEQWEQHITPKTRLILLNTPCNPTGRVYSKEELTIVAELAKEHDLIVVSDEVYARIIFDSNVFISIAAIDCKFRSIATTLSE